MTKGDESAMSIYSFGTKRYDHKFCPTCGSGMMFRNRSMGALGINLRTVKEFGMDELQQIETNFYDGRNEL